jgi:hypothetical protein
MSSNCSHAHKWNEHTYGTHSLQKCSQHMWKNAMICTTMAVPFCCTHTSLWVSHSSEKLTTCYIMI